MASSSPWSPMASSHHVLPAATEAYMRFRPFLSPLHTRPRQNPRHRNPHPSSFLSLNPSSSSSMTTGAHRLPRDPEEDPDEALCAALDGACSLSDAAAPPPEPAEIPPSGELRVARAWAHWRRIGAPRLVVATMVDNSELPFRMLCRRYGAEAAYTPMLHSRIFYENEKYRRMEFTTCKIRRARKPDGVCLVVGSCALGFCNNTTSDVIFSSSSVKKAGNSVAQYFWESIIRTISSTSLDLFGTRVMRSNERR